MKKFLIIPLLFACYMGMAQINSSSIIGKPIRVGNLLVAQNDFANRMNWYDAKKVCSALGDGWRLPTLPELYFLYQNRVKIGGFAKYSYWSSTSSDKYSAWIQGFTNGGQGHVSKDSNGNVDVCNVRAVRVF
jgi:hypothetical protein